MSRYRGDEEDFYRRREGAEDPRRRRAEEDSYGEPRRGGGGDFYNASREDYGRGREESGRDLGPRFEDERRAYEGRPVVERGREFYDERDNAQRARRPAYEEAGPPRRSGATRSHLRCRDIMTRDVTVAMRATTLEEVARLMKDEDTGVIPVVELGGAEGETVSQHAAAATNAAPGGSRVLGNGKLVGLITDRDIVVRAVAEGRDARAMRAEEIMTTDIHTAQPNDRVIEVIRKMGDKQVRRVPIVDREMNLRGIISMADVALETEDDRELAEALEEISSGSSFWNRVFG